VFTFAYGSRKGAALLPLAKPAVKFAASRLRGVLLTKN